VDNKKTMDEIKKMINSAIDRSIVDGFSVGQLHVLVGEPGIDRSQPDPRGELLADFDGYDKEIGPSCTIGATIDKDTQTITLFYYYGKKATAKNTMIMYVSHFLSLMSGRRYSQEYLWFVSFLKKHDIDFRTIVMQLRGTKPRDYARFSYAVPYVEGQTI